MNQVTLLKTLACFSLVFANASLAQEKGRTDGPENSEFGKGGYEPGTVSNPFSSRSSRLSVSLLGGASLYSASALPGPTSSAPLFAGASVSFWADDWFLVDVAASYLVNAQRFQLLVGPRMRTVSWRVAGYVGLHAGGMFDGDGLRFGISPNAGIEVPVSNNWLLGGGAAWDLPIPEGPNSKMAVRLFISAGYRF